MAKLPVSVIEVGKMNIEGNITPHSWYDNLTLENGKPNLVAITILADLLYWHRPTEVRNETTGRISGYRKKFRANKLQRSYQYYVDLYNFGKEQTKNAFNYLEELGLITREFRHFTSDTGTPMSNVMFVDLIPDKVREITYSRLEKAHIGIDTHMGGHENRDGMGIDTDTYTETTTETTTENNVPVGNFEDDFSDIIPEDTSPSPDSKNGKEGISPDSVLAAVAARNEALAQNPREHPVYKVFRDYDPEAAAEFLSLLSTVPNDYPDFTGDLQPLLCAFIAVTGARPLIAGEGRLASQTKRQWKAELQYHLDNFRDDKPELSVPKIAYLYLQAMAAYRKSTKNDFPVVKSPNTLTAYMATEVTRYEKRKSNGNESKS